MRTGEDFARASAEKRISEWRFRECSVCYSPIGYVFEDGMVGFDGSCGCTSARGVAPRTWDDVARQYNMQTGPGTIAKYDAFWGFEEGR